MNILQIIRPTDSVNSETIFRILGFPVNNSTLCIILMVFLFAFFCFFVVRKFKIMPGALQTVVEMIYEAIENLILQLTASKRETKMLLPFVGSVFIFVGISNLLGSLPAITNVTFDGKSILRIPTADFNTTFAIALSAIIIIQIMSIKDFGIFGYIGRFLRFKEVYLGFKKGIKSGVISLVDFFVGFLDIISEGAKIISLSLRLFGNIYAGMVLLVVISRIMAYGLPSFLMGIGLMFAIVQAIVFGSLITVYYSLSVRNKSEEDI